LGGLLSTACFLIGTIVITHDYHRALMMQQQPEELDWQTLADRGPVDNAFIRLIDVELDQADQLGQFADTFGDLQDLDPNADPEAAFEELMAAMEQVNPLEMVEMIVAPVKVVPKGTEPTTIPDAIVIPRNEQYLADAQRQLSESNTLAGFVSTFQGDEFIRAVMNYAGGEDLAEALDDAGTSRTVYTIEPMTEPLDRSAAAANFWFCGFGMSLGLILCGSGGPSLTTCVFFPLPSTLSLLGYPLRYGRGGKTARMFFVVVGVGLLSYGYHLLIQQGQFGRVGGNPVLHSLGFSCTFLGLAAMLAAPAQWVSRKVNASMDVAPAREPEIKMSVTQACSLEPIEVQTVYRDRDLIASTFTELADEIRFRSESLTAVGFSSPEPQQWLENETQIPAAIQLGCQGMVVCEMESIDGHSECRLVSVLHDGLTVITLSSNINTDSDRRVGSNGMYQRCRTEEPDQMLTQHLEETISIAERRNTSVVTFDESELDHVCLFARRVLADIRNQYGEVIVDISGARYGRFRYPMQPVTEAAIV
jgi:hypothetical protein